MQLSEQIRLARHLLHQKKYEEANTLITQLSSQDPNHPMVLSIEMDYYLHQGNLEPAERILARLLLNEPHNTYYLARKAYLFEVKQDYKKAVDLLMDIYHQSDDPQVCWQLARLLNKIGQLENAAFYFEKARQAISDRHELRYLGFQIYKKLENREQALACLDAALLLNPESSFYMAQKKRYLMEEKGVSAVNWEKSLKYSGQIADGETCKNLAEQFIAEKNWEKAERYLLQALQLDSSEYLKNRLAWVYYKWGRYSPALQLFLELPDRNYLNNPFLNMVSKSAAQCHRQLEVIEHLKELINRSPVYNRLWGTIRKLQTSLPVQPLSKSIKDDEEGANSSAEETEAL